MKKKLLTLVLAVAATMNLSAQKLIDLEHHFYTQEVMDLFTSRMAAGIPPYWDAEKGNARKSKYNLVKRKIT